MEWYALVHKPIKLIYAMEIPDAVKAITKEWDKLKNQKAWIYESVRKKSEVIKEARETGVGIHLGSVMCLCHLKNAQLDKKFWSYKGRIVFRGDNVKDEDGCYAIWGEQGTSASHMMASKVVDAVSHMPGMDGEDADATGAYTQTELGPDCPTTWITLPKEHWLPEWHGNFSEKDPPVVILRLNLYGHPKASLYWENFCKCGVFKCGFEKVVGWECLYKHKKKGLLLSIYVDDLKLGGIKENIKPMWDELIHQ